jgi:hypothetical protein
MSFVNLASQSLVSVGLAISEMDRRTTRQARIIALSITGGIALLLLLAFLFIQIITPIPAIPPDPEPIELTLEMGLLDGTGGDAATQGGGSEGNTGMPGMQNPNNASDPTPKTPADDGAVTGDDPENPAAPSSNHDGDAKQPTVSKETLAAMEMWKKNKGAASINIGGDGKGDPYTGGLGDGSGSDRGPKTGGDVGDGDKPGGKDGPDKVGNGNRVRRIMSKPEIVNPTQSEGKVVVNVYVNREGKVVKTEVNPAGTTTMNSTLRATATQSAYKIVFDADPRGPELLLLPIDIYFTLK